MDYLWSIWGSKTISGQHNRQPLEDPTVTTREIQRITGKTPGLWGSDFMFGNNEIKWRDRMIDTAKQQWVNGSFVTIMMNVCPPYRDENCEWTGRPDSVESGLDDTQWWSLLTEGQTLNRRWKQRLDLYASFLKKLQDDNIICMFRPFQEINGDWFWWAGKGERSRRLYQMTHNYMTRTKGLNSLIWVWTLSDSVTNDLAGAETYWPGHEYVDIAALDIYNHDNNRQAKPEQYSRMQQITSNGKLLALGETGRIPSPATLDQQPKWVYFLQWVEHLTDPEWNTEAGIRFLKK